MGTYDFTTRPDRLAQHTAKWRETETNPDLLQMWIADMDFLPHPDIKKDIQAYAAEHVFGYPYAPDSLYAAIQKWEKEEHGYEVAREHIVLIEGVVPAISTAIQAFTQEGDSVLINTPVYPPFARSVRLNNRNLVSHSLIKRNGHFEIDFEQLEKDIVEQEVKLYVLCSPHNPGGRVWTKEELQTIGDICKRHGVLVASDEIHQDLALFGNKHVPFHAVDESFKDFGVIMGSATKTFNIAGTKNSFTIIPNPKLRKAFTSRQLANNQHEVPTIGLITTESAFTHGKAWLEELKAVLEENIEYAVDYLREHTKISVMKPEGTYLIWLDFSAYGLTNNEVQEKLKKEAKVVLNDGFAFGTEGSVHARLNVATPFATVEEACRRIASVFGK